MSQNGRSHAKSGHDDARKAVIQIITYFFLGRLVLQQVDFRKYNVSPRSDAVAYL